MTCDICNQKVKTKQSNTTNLWSHLLRNHPEQYAVLKPLPVAMKTKSKPESSDGQRTLTSFQKHAPNSKRHHEITDAVIKFICQDLQPIYVLDKPGFKRLISTLDPRYDLPSRKRASESLIPKLYNLVR